MKQVSSEGNRNAQEILAYGYIVGYSLIYNNNNNFLLFRSCILILIRLIVILILQFGVGIERNFTEAFRVFSKLAAQGYPSGQQVVYGLMWV